MNDPPASRHREPHHAADLRGEGMTSSPFDGCGRRDTGTDESNAQHPPNPTRGPNQHPLTGPVPSGMTFDNRSLSEPVPSDHDPGSCNPLPIKSVTAQGSRSQ